MARSSSQERYVLITGGAGYIGSHTTLEIIEEGNYKPVVVDNLVNSSKEAIKRVEKLTQTSIDFYDFDLNNKSKLIELFKKYDFVAVLHFAALKSPSESVANPLQYYKTNVQLTVNLIEVMNSFNVKNIIFSSTFYVYGEPVALPMAETHPTGKCPNPYGRSKYFVEEILKDISKADEKWNVIILRYFNPVGAHPSGEIGEDPNGTPTTLLYYILQVLVKNRPHVSIFGDDYNTADGTGVRDYIHIVDLARGNLAAIKKLETKCGFKIYNLGSGNACSVLSLIRGMEKASGKTVPYEVLGRRDGDVSASYADTQLALKELGWMAERGLEEFCVDAWRWQSQYPNGYEDNSNEN